MACTCLAYIAKGGNISSDEKPRSYKLSNEETNNIIRHALDFNYDEIVIIEDSTTELCYRLLTITTIGQYMLVNITSMIPTMSNTKSCVFSVGNGLEQRKNVQSK